MICNTSNLIQDKMVMAYLKMRKLEKSWLFNLKPISYYKLKSKYEEKRIQYNLLEEYKDIIYNRILKS